MEAEAKHNGIREILCAEQTPEPCGVVIYGASGDLTRRKLAPALFNLYVRGLLPDNFFLLGFARTPFDTDTFRDRLAAELPADAAAAARDGFIRRWHYFPGDYRDPAVYPTLCRRLEDYGVTHGTLGNLVFYLATPPELYGPIVDCLGESGLTACDPHAGPWRRVVVEKPFGRDLDSARGLDAQLHRTLAEEQIYRIDHYLGKETVQNILMFRFANTVFEPVWTRDHVDHVQMTVAESIGVENRAGYFDHAGLLRDMFQNHILQLLALVAMEPPASFAADRVRDEKVKLLRAVRSFESRAIADCVVRGQYGPGVLNNTELPGYLEEQNISPGSCTETFVAATVFIDNWRWNGVPFYIRSGKRLPRKLTEIAIVFKRVPHSIFTPLGPNDLRPNVLVMAVQPEEGVGLTIQAKRPGAKLCISDLTMDFRYRSVFGTNPPDAYERLLLDAMLGDQTLFIRRDTVEVAWSLLMPILEHWAEPGTESSLYSYPAGTWGPEQAAALMQGADRVWRD